MEGIRELVSLRLLWGLNVFTCKRGRREMLDTWSILCKCWLHELIKLPAVWAVWKQLSWVMMLARL